MNIAVIPLGCSKNTVDLERMLGRLTDGGYTLAGDLFDAETVIVNTCGFIESAKQEAIENILLLAEKREQNPNMNIVVTGCLAERYRDEILQLIPEVTAVVTPGRNGDIVDILQRVQNGESGLFDADIEQMPEHGRRVMLSPPHFAYIKIADGCDNRCSYCAIPLIRGKQRSRPMEDVLSEARELVADGKRELVLVAQDTTAFGKDTGDGSLAELLTALDGIEGLCAVRVMYAYPELITEQLVEVMAKSRTFVHYIDMPIQHISDNVLQRMNRHGDANTIRQAMALLKTAMPDMTLRTTVMVGFPGETEQDFAELLEFVKQGEFEHMGCFAFSPEEGTAAAIMKPRVPSKVKHEREKRIMTAQYDNVVRRQRARVGTVLKACAEDVCETTGRVMLRPTHCAPEVDTVIYCDGEAIMFETYNVTITGTEGYDLVGEIQSMEETH